MASDITIDRRSAADGSRAQISAWLAGVALLVAAMVIVGGATRLTDSGLSITEWQPLLGAIPPMNEADWQAAFAKYKTIPQAAIVNKTMTLHEFKFIYWWEWGHRQLGRFIGVAFALPFAWFALRGLVPRALMIRLAGLLVLGGLQGAAGWFMVKSGLVERIDVSPYRLTLHLTLAVLIFSALVWTVLDLNAARERLRFALSAGQRRMAAALPVLVVMQIALGGLVAGNKAGRAYNTWPTMDGQWIPDALLALKPWYLNLTENMTTVQFNHRLAAYLVLAAALWHAFSLARSVEAPRSLVTSANALAVAVVAQAALGVWTLLMAVPISLGLLHQGGALVVLALALYHAHRVHCGPERASALL